MYFKETSLKGVYLITPDVFSDERGYFFETYNAEKVIGTPLEQYTWVQDNESKSVRGVLRGMHFQKGDHSQAKLVRVISGSVFDVAVDMRKDSPSFGRWFGAELNSENKHQMLVPRGFAHGFIVLSEFAIFAYKCDNYYNPGSDSGFIYNDPTVGIEWPDLGSDLVISGKDKNLSSFESAYKF